MATLNAVFRLQDGFSTTINKFMRSADKMAQKVMGASGSVDKLDQTIAKVGRSTSGIDKITKSLGRLINVTALATGAIQGMGISDEYINTRARLDIMNDGLQTTAELQEKIMDSAQRSRGSYTDMAKSISKMGILAGEAFNNNNEVIAFTELVQKSFKVGGANTSEQQASMLQLTQAMGSGKLQGDEFRSIMENAPMIADAIAKYTGVSKGELKKLSSDGVITSDIIKNAMFSMADDIEGKFDSMPKTFSDIWTSIKNGAIEAFAPVIVQINELINTDAFAGFVDLMIQGFNVIAIGLSGIVNGFIWLGGVVKQNWSIIAPILMAIGIVMLPTIAGALWSLLAPTLANVAAWMMMNIPLLMVIASIAGIIYVLGELGVTFQDVFGFVGGLVGVFVAGFYNYFAYLWNIVAEFINFFGNVFTNPIASVQKLFYDLSVNVLGFIEGIARGIEILLNSIPGVEVNITSGLTNLKNDLAAKSQDISDAAGLNEWAKKLEFVDYGFAYSKGREVGDDAYGSLAGSLGGLFKGFDKGGSATSAMDAFGLDKLMNNGGIPVTEKGGKPLKVSVDKEDIKYLRDLADREYVAKYSTATLAPNVTITFGEVKETADSKQIANVVKTLLEEEIAIMGEG